MVAVATMAMVAKALRWSNHLKQFTVMRKIFIALAAVAAVVGCSKENTPADVVAKNNFTLDASIITDDTRVVVGGEKFTEVSWEVGDKIRLESDNGYNGDLTATASGRTDIRFEGTESPKATVDTYYAVYPSSNINDAKVTFYLDNQPGDDVAALVAKTEDAISSDIKMTFKPINSLLHVAVNGVGSLSKAEFMSYTGKTLPETFTYDYTNDTITHNDSRASYEVTNFSADGFFFSLPADLDMSEGYVVRLTDASGNVCTKAYEGKSFKRGTTTCVEIDFVVPTVTLGAKTSYSYYLAGDSATANKCANTDIFFVTGKNGESCASSYAGVQDAMITDLGYEVDGATYTYSAGQVSWDKATNTFCMISNPDTTYSTSWGEKTGIKAFVVVEGKKVYSTNTVWLTGLPYGYNFVNGSLDAYRKAGWTTNGSLRVANQSQVGHDAKLVLYSNLGLQTANGYIVSPEFFVPNSVNVQPQIVRNVYATSGGISQTGYVGAVSSVTSKNTSSVSFTDKGTADYSDYRILGKDSWMSPFQISPSNRYISISSTNKGGAICHYFLFEAHFRYAE